MSFVLLSVLAIGDLGVEWALTNSSSLESSSSVKFSFGRLNDTSRGVALALEALNDDGGVLGVLSLVLQLVLSGRMVAAVEVHSEPCVYEITAKSQAINF